MLVYACVFSCGFATLATLSTARAAAGVTRSPAPLGALVNDALRRDRDSAIIGRGNKERGCLQVGKALLAVKQRGGMGGGGLAPAPGAKAKPKGKAKAAKKSRGARKQSALAASMAAQGVVRIDGALTPQTAEALRHFVDAEKRRAEQEVADGTHDFDSRFADLVLVSNRSDFLLPLRGAVVDALQELLGRGSTLGPLVEELMGEDGVLQEIACLISYPGSQQQPLHPDTPYSSPPSLYATFIALQDVDEEMVRRRLPNTAPPA
jgi:hypothetical protein